MCLSVSWGWLITRVGAGRQPARGAVRGARAPLALRRSTGSDRSLIDDAVMGQADSSWPTAENVSWREAVRLLLGVDFCVVGWGAVVEPKSQVLPTEALLEDHKAAHYSPGSGRRVDRPTRRSRVAWDRDR